MAGEKTQAQIDAQIDAGIRVNGNKEITPPIHNAIEKALSNSYINKIDAGLVVQALLGYSSVLTPSDNKHFTPKKYVDDLFDLCLLLDGTNAMTGDLDMGINSIRYVDYLYGPSDDLVLDCANRLFKDAGGLTVLDFQNRAIQANFTVSAVTGTNALLSGDYRPKDANYTVAVLDEVVECTANTFTVTLYTAVGYFNREVHIVNTGAGTITLEGDGSETINGAANQTILAGEGITVRSNNTNWIIISRY